MSLFECIQRPLEIARNISSRNEGVPEEAHAAVAKHFAEVLFQDPKALLQVPCLTPNSTELALGSQQLVRFRGMVSDMLNPEFFVGAYQRAGRSWQHTAYSDMPPADFGEAGATRICERRPLYCVPVPCEAPWAAARWKGQPQEPQTPSAADRIKRAREPSEEPLHADALSAMDTDAVHPTSCCTGRDQSDSCVAKQARTQAEAVAVAEPAAAAGAGMGPGAPPAHPVAETGDCLVYAYGDGEQFKLHDVVEVLGVVSVLPGLAAAHMQQEGQQDMDMDVWQEQLGAHPPTSKVLRLHALAMRTAPPRTMPFAAAHQPQQPSPQALIGGASVLQLRERALGLLALALGGDELAAEYVLMQAMGTVFSREADLPRGLVSLNIVGGPGATKEQVGPALHAALSALLPACAHLPLGLTSLNATRWAPSKDHTSGRLLRGRLQLAGGTVLLLDETAMEAGELGEQAIANLKAAKAVLQEQQLPCDFQFYSCNFLVDLPTLVLSEGRSLLRDAIDLTLPLQPTAANWPAAATPAAATPAAAQATTAATAGAAAPGAAAAPSAVAAAIAAAVAAGEADGSLEAVRAYVGMARAVEGALPGEAADELARAFVELHTADKSFGAQEFNACVTMAKLLSNTFCHETFSPSCWHRVMQLEAQRKARLGQ